MNDLDQNDYRKLIEMAPILCVDVILKLDGKYLLFRRCNEPLRGEWWVIGGRVRKGEDPLAAVTRKLIEETGLVKVDGFQFVGYYNEVFPFSSVGRGPYHTVSLVFTLELCDEDLSAIKLDAQHDSWGVDDDLPPGFAANLVTSTAGALP